MKTTFLLTIISALLISTGVASAATRQYEGTVVSVNRDAKTFRVHDFERGTIRVKVRSSTRFERIGGFSGLRKSMRGVEATGGGSHGGAAGDQGADDHGSGGHGGGADDQGADDHGSGGHGSGGHGSGA